MENIKIMPLNERPRERLIVFGVEVLTDTELLSVIIGSGSKGHGVHKLAQDVLKIIEQQNDGICYADLSKIKGIGPAKASLLAASLEFSRRRIRPEGTKIKEPKDIMPLVQYLADRKQEYFTCTSLNGAHEVIRTRIVTVGLVNFCQVHPREVLSDPITDRACSVVIAHNHPSGNLEPSPEDIALTDRLKKAAEILGIKLLDHLIFSKRGFFSFKEGGIL
ncbi:MAG: DNA repair protein RadC [bacterium]|nr:DNA repair protein RadC [bacterium]